MNCYCGSSQTFEQCCHKVISGVNKASSPGQLMRSRCSAYTIKNAQYLFDTTAKAQQTEQLLGEISQWANQTTWLKLVVHHAAENKSVDFDNKHPPTVNFSAWYLHDKKYYQMTELSSFVIENEQWKYSTGESLTHNELPLPKRNGSCPCGSNKKFKRCCSS
jgi:SEC-C motif-containing protein